MRNTGRRCLTARYKENSLVYHTAILAGFNDNTVCINTMIACIVLINATHFQRGLVIRDGEPGLNVFFCPAKRR